MWRSASLPSRVSDTLQLCPPADYFLVMLKIIRGRSKAALLSTARRAPLVVVLALGNGCEERDRLTFPTPSDGVGPVTTIDQPIAADTTVEAGPAFFVNGRSTDPDGVDTVYFLVTGGNHNFQPFTPNPPTDTVSFGVPIITSGQSGDTYTINIHGVDALGNPGDTSTRVIHIQ